MCLTAPNSDGPRNLRTWVQRCEYAIYERWTGNARAASRGVQRGLLTSYSLTHCRRNTLNNCLRRSIAVDATSAASVVVTPSASVSAASVFDTAVCSLWCSRQLWRHCDRTVPRTTCLKSPAFTATFLLQPFLLMCQAQILLLQVCSTATVSFQSRVICLPLPSRSLVQSLLKLSMCRLCLMREIWEWWAYLWMALWILWNLMYYNVDF